MSDRHTQRYKDREWLYEKVSEGLTQAEIARMCGVTQSNIAYYMSKYDISAANLKPQSEEEYLVDLRRVANELGRSPTIKEYNEHGKYTEQPFYDRFGSWTNAIKRIDMEPRKLWDIEKADLLADIQKVAAIYGRAPSCNEYLQHGSYGANTFYTKFGGWRAAVEEAGLDMDIPPGVDASDSDLIDDLVRVTELLGKTPSQVEYEEHGKYSKSTLYRRFNGWNDAIERAGLEVNESKPGYYATDDEIIEDLDRVLSKYKSAVPAQVYDEDGRYSWQTVTRRFGSWPKALRAAGYEPLRGYWDKDRSVHWDSYWEYEIANILDDIGFNWERQHYFETDCANYLADFIIEEFVILEVKGRVDYGDGGGGQIEALRELIEIGKPVVVIGQEEARRMMLYNVFILYPPRSSKVRTVINNLMSRDDHNFRGGQ